MNIRCSDKLLDPKKLIDIADFGIKNPELATSAFGEILEQISGSTLLKQKSLTVNGVTISKDAYNLLKQTL